MTNNHTPHVLIVGGGITGLAAAWRLQTLAGEQGAPLRYTVLEKAERWGGKIGTEHVHGYGDQPFIVEKGPDSFISQKPWGLQLARELGLDDRLLGTNDHRRKTYVLNRGKLTPLPDGVMLIVPTKIMPFVTSPLISPLGKLRMGLDLFIPAKRDGQDETLADFMRRRLGQEALDKLGEPLLSGIYNADAEEQSLLATFPRFRALEEKYGSLVRGMLAARRNAPPPPPNGKQVSTFVSLRDGAEELVHHLVKRLTGDLRLNAGVARLERTGDGYRAILEDGEALHADAVILTTPAKATAQLLRDLAPDTVPHLESIRTVSTGTVSLAFRREEIRPLNGFGVVIPRSERRRINAITWSSTKFDHRAPEGHELIRVFFGGSRTPQTFDLPEDELVAVVRQELADILDIRAEPLLYRVYRWRDAQPQYDVGHLDRVAAIEAGLPPGLWVAGSPYRGVGIPDCVHQGWLAAERVVNTAA
ncbi:MAG: protoporphyrinogen oxidase [Caldilineae bacterium]|nr:MAG: protoporphyrinogen oxidase [Caldilineae bacterium]